MKRSRFEVIRDAALAAKRSMAQWGYVRMNRLAHITVEESGFLNAHFRELLPFTRLFLYEEDAYKEDVSRPSRSRQPIVREIWVGARSLAALEEPDTLREEDEAELTDLQTLLYDGILTDEDGVTRKIRNGDIIQIAWGSNEDLDALFMDEPADERSEHDQLMRELTRDQVRANTYQETEMMPSRIPHSMPLSALREGANEGLDAPRDDLYLWQVAHRLAERILPKFPQYTLRELSDEAFKRLKCRDAGIKFDHQGRLVSGEFVTRKDYWDALESNLRALERFPKRKARPVKMPKKLPGTDARRDKVPAWLPEFERTDKARREKRTARYRALFPRRKAAT